ncbi:MAG TPA: hypothetical protein VG056_05330 [Pirellulales bacterium]|nr:hypothetical protein [Pirellulales bacterium]
MDDHQSKRRIMVFERIETLKREYTDKYVVVDESRPELARFKGQVGVVKTVNMSGRALIEFQDYIANIGWYDIDLDFVKVVPKPEAAAPTTEAKPAAKKAAPAKPAPTKPAATAPAAVQPVEKEPAAGEKKLSPIELARMQGAAKRAEGAAPAKPKPAVAEVGKSAATPAVGKKPSTAEILAAARTKKAAAVSELPEMPTSAIAEPPATEETATIAAETIPAETVAAATSDAAPAAPAPMKPKAIAPLAMAGPKPTTTAEKIAWCRANDAGRNAR